MRVVSDGNQAWIDLLACGYPATMTSLGALSWGSGAGQSVGSDDRGGLLATGGLLKRRG